jgi:uroporphyrinogen-III synthase
MPTTRAAAKAAGSSNEKNHALSAGDKRKAKDREVSPARDHKPAKASKKYKDGVKPIESSLRGAKIPSTIIEKGIVYFLARGKVNTEAPKSLSELQRSYLVLRRLPKDAKLGEGAVPDAPVSRLIAIPKKSLPKSGKDRFMVFVEKSKSTMTDLKESFFSGEQHETKTRGTSKTPPIMPIGEGVYAITNTGRSSHLAYILAIPSEPGKLQSDLGIRERGSFIISLKNPTVGGPANAQLSEKPNFPKHIMDDFGGLRWIPIQKSEHLDYPNAQLLVVGEGQGEFRGAVIADHGSGRDAQEEGPEEELEKLDDEENIRISHLKGMTAPLNANFMH